jgi:hypothetical protein
MHKYPTASVCRYVHNICILCPDPGKHHLQSLEACQRKISRTIEEYFGNSISRRCEILR